MENIPIAIARLGLTVFASSLYQAVRNPELSSFIWVGGIALIIGLAGFGIQRWLSRRERAAATAAAAHAETCP